MHSSIKLDSPIELIDVTPVNPLISRCQIKVCYVGDEPNRNGSIITKEVAKEMANSLPGSPIVGYFNKEKGDFEEHNSELVVEDGNFFFKDTTRPYGFVDLNAPVWFAKYKDDGVEHEYLCTEGYIWTGQYPEASRIITRGNNQSMELDSALTQGDWTNSPNGDAEFFIINETIISKLCILGEDVEPCFEGASVSKVQFSLNENFRKQMFALVEEMKSILEEGGTSVENEKEMSKELETPVVEDQEVEETEATVVEENVEEKEDENIEENVEDNAVEVEESEVEPTEVKDNKVEYNLDEIQEYVDLTAQYSALETEYNSLKAEKEAADATIEELTQFKKGIERKEKESMIDGFYMLSDEDKKDVIENIDNYSLDEIESKLSVICVRNKVSFDLEENKNEEAGKAATTFNLSGDAEDTSTPAWVKAVQSTVAKTK